VADAPDVVGLAGDHFALGLALGGLELLASALDPREPLDDGDSHRVVVEGVGAATRTRPTGG
jgi:hypothetical protein